MENINAGRNGTRQECVEVDRDVGVVVVGAQWSARQGSDGLVI